MLTDRHERRRAKRKKKWNPIRSAEPRESTVGWRAGGAGGVVAVLHTICIIGSACGFACSLRDVGRATARRRQKYKSPLSSLFFVDFLIFRLHFDTRSRWEPAFPFSSLFISFFYRHFLSSERLIERRTGGSRWCLVLPSFSFYWVWKVVLCSNDAELNLIFIHFPFYWNEVPLNDIYLVFLWLYLDLFGLRIFTHVCQSIFSFKFFIVGFDLVTLV